MSFQRHQYELSVNFIILRSEPKPVDYVQHRPWTKALVIRRQENRSFFEKDQHIAFPTKAKRGVLLNRVSDLLSPCFSVPALTPSRLLFPPLVKERSSCLSLRCACDMTLCRPLFGRGMVKQGDKKLGMLPLFQAKKLLEKGPQFLYHPLLDDFALLSEKRNRR